MSATGLMDRPVDGLVDGSWMTTASWPHPVDTDACGGRGRRTILWSARSGPRNDRSDGWLASRSDGSHRGSFGSFAAPNWGFASGAARVTPKVARPWLILRTTTAA